MSDYTITLDAVMAQMEARYYGVDNDEKSNQLETERVYSLTIGTGEEPIETHPNFRDFAGTPNNPRNGARFVDQETGAVVLPQGFSINSIEDGDGAGQFMLVDRRGTHFEKSDGTEVSPAEKPSRRAIAAVFDGFVGGSMTGVTSFLDANNTIWRESWTSSRPLDDSSSGMVGKVMNPPGPVPDFGTRNWLYVGMNMEMKTTYKQVGENGDVSEKSVFSLSREWRLSGRRGWHPAIYQY
jgi:hypothetical protein